MAAVPHGSGFNAETQSVSAMKKALVLRLRLLQPEVALVAADADNGELLLADFNHPGHRVPSRAEASLRGFEFKARRAGRPGDEQRTTRTCDAQRRSGRRRYANDADGVVGGQRVGCNVGDFT